MHRKIGLSIFLVLSFVILIIQSQCASTSQFRLTCAKIQVKTIQGDDNIEKLYMEWDFNQDPIPFLTNKEIVVMMGIGQFSMQRFNSDEMLWDSVASPWGRRLRLRPDEVILEDRFGGRRFESTIRNDKYSFEIPWDEYFGRETNLIFYVHRIELTMEYYKWEKRKYSCPNFTF